MQNRRQRRKWVTSVHLASHQAICVAISDQQPGMQEARARLLLRAECLGVHKCEANRTRLCLGLLMLNGSFAADHVHVSNVPPHQSPAVDLLHMKPGA